MSKTTHFFRRRPTLWLNWGVCLSGLCSVSALAASPCVPAEVPGELAFLSGAFAEVVENACKRNTNLAQNNILDAQIKTAKTSKLPTVSFSSNGSLNKNWEYDNATQTNTEQSYTKNLSAGVEASQSLWNNGNNDLNISVSKYKLEVNTWDEIAWRQQLQTEFTRDVLKLLNEKRVLTQRELDLENWKKLNELTHRKAKAGHLSQRDLLQSDKELASALSEVEQAKETLRKDLSLLTVRYELQKSKPDLAALRQWEQNMTPALQRAQEMLQNEHLQETVAAHSSDLKKIGSQRSLLATQTHQSEAQEFAPDLRATAGINGNYIDNVNRTRLPKDTDLPNWNLSGSIGLRFNMSLWNPKSLAVTEEYYAQRQQISTQEEAIVRNISVQCRTLQEEQASAALRLTLQKKVLETAQALVAANNQLYQAGLIDTFQLIRGLQDQSTQERTIIETENQMRSTALNTLLAATMGRL